MPKGFVVHTSGDKIKTSKHGEENTIHARQRIVDIYPYVIAGRYVTKQIGSDRQKIYLWTRKPQDAGDIRAVSDSLIKTLANYNLVFGARSVANPPSRLFGKAPIRRVKTVCHCGWRNARSYQDASPNETL